MRELRLPLFYCKNIMQICKNIMQIVRLIEYESGNMNVKCENCEVYVAAKSTIRLAQFHRDRPRYRIKIRATEKILWLFVS